MVSLDFIDTESILTSMFEFRETDPFFLQVNEDGEENSRFAVAGYDSSNFILLLGPLFFIMLAFIALKILHLLVWLIVKPCGDNFLTKRVRGN